MFIIIIYTYGLITAVLFTFCTIQHTKQPRLNIVLHDSGKVIGRLINGALKMHDWKMKDWKMKDRTWLSCM